MTFSKNQAFRILVKSLLFGAAFSLLGALSGSLYLWRAYNHTLLPNQHIANVSVGGQTPEEAVISLTDTLSTPNYTVLVRSTDQEFATSSAWLQLTPQFTNAVENAYAYGHTGSVFQQLTDRWISILEGPQHTSLTSVYNQDRLDTWIQSIAQQVEITGSEPQAIWTGYDFRINPGKRGQRLNTQKLQMLIHTRIGADTEVAAPIETTFTELTAEQKLASEERVQGLRNLMVTLEVSPAEPPKRLTAADFDSWLRLPTGFREASLSADLATLVSSWDRPAQNAVFSIENDILTEFQPDSPGRTVDQSALQQVIIDTVLSVENAKNNTADRDLSPVLSVPISETPASIQLRDTNNLGINERLGQGISTFFGSIPNRVHNVEITSNKLHATIVKPGEEFSFNDSIGAINQSTGYKTAYVIQNGRTVLGDGGGVCQVSTTVFRAILDAGLPVTQWKAHSYRVGYYEQNEKPGFDATIFSPSVDLRFKNDTEHAIVVSTQIDVANRHLVVEIWGTSDGRTSTISNYRSWNARPAPAPLYQEDPSIPAGRTQQIDWAAPGLNTAFTYTVTTAKGEEHFQREFTSYFRPWQAVYLVGTGN